MEACVQIPVPAASDVESVVTALEMAALFGAKGEGNEVVRWLKRAAESAGAEGHDERALSLARTAADLDDQLRTAPDYGRTPSERPLPSANGETHDPDALPIPLGRRSGFPKPPSRPPSTTSSSSPTPSSTTRPPAPSQRTQPPPKPPLSQRSSTIASSAARLEAPTSTPAPPRVGALSRPSVAPSPRPSSAPSNGSRTTSLTSSPARAGKAQTLKESPNAKASTKANGATNATPGPTAPEVSSARTAAAPEKPHQFAKGSVCSRQTARVSVQASTEPGVYVMRLLDDDETTLPGRAVEGLLVLVDPDAKLPSEDSN